MFSKILATAAIALCIAVVASVTNAATHTYGTSLTLIDTVTPASSNDVWGCLFAYGQYVYVGLYANDHKLKVYTTAATTCTIGTDCIAVSGVTDIQIEDAGASHLQSLIEVVVIGSNAFIMSDSGEYVVKFDMTTNQQITGSSGVWSNSTNSDGYIDSCSVWSSKLICTEYRDTSSNAHSLYYINPSGMSTVWAEWSGGMSQILYSAVNGNILHAASETHLFSYDLGTRTYIGVTAASTNTDVSKFYSLIAYSSTLYATTETGANGYKLLRWTNANTNSALGAASATTTWGTGTKRMGEGVVYGKKLYVASYSDNTVFKIDLETHATPTSAAAGAGESSKHAICTGGRAGTLVTATRQTGIHLSLYDAGEIVETDSASSAGQVAAAAVVAVLSLVLMMF